MWNLGSFDIIASLILSCDYNFVFRISGNVQVPVMWSLVRVTTRRQSEADDWWLINKRQASALTRAVRSLRNSRSSPIRHSNFLSYSHLSFTESMSNWTHFSVICTSLAAKLNDWFEPWWKIHGQELTIKFVTNVLFISLTVLLQTRSQLEDSC